MEMNKQTIPTMYRTLELERVTVGQAFERKTREQLDVACCGEEFAWLDAGFLRIFAETRSVQPRRKHAACTPAEFVALFISRDV